MEIATQADGSAATLTVSGRIDATEMMKLEQAAAAALTGPVRYIIIDMHAVDYISSAGLRAILMIAKRAKAVAGGVALFGLQQGVEEVMTTSGFATIVPIAQTRTEALEAIGG